MPNPAQTSRVRLTIFIISIFFFFSLLGTGRAILAILLSSAWVILAISCHRRELFLRSLINRLAPHSRSTSHSMPPLDASKPNESHLSLSFGGNCIRQ